MKKSAVAIIFLTVALLAFIQPANAQKTETEKKTKAFNYEELIDRYFESLNEPEDARRRVLIEQIWAADGIFVYPGSETKGRAAIGADVLKVQKLYPRAIVRRTGEIEVLEKRYVRFSWEFGVPNEDVLISGVDFAVVGDDGKLKLVVGYFDFISEKAKR